MTNPGEGLYMNLWLDVGWDEDRGFYLGNSTFFNQVGDEGYVVDTSTLLLKRKITNIADGLTYFTDYEWETLNLTQSQGDYIGEVEAEHGSYPDDGIQGGYWYVSLGAAAPEVYINVNGVYKQAEVYGNVNGVWKEFQIFVNVNNNWKEL
jgi:hypothetical protein